MKRYERDRFVFAALLSLALHSLIFLLLFILALLGLLNLNATPPAQPDPVVLELTPPPQPRPQPPPQPEPEPQQQPEQQQPPPPSQDPVTYVENDEADGEKPEEGFFAERDSRSAAPDPSGAGVAPDAEREIRQAEGSREDPSGSTRPLSGDAPLADAPGQKVFSKNALTGSPDADARRPVPEPKEGEVPIADPRGAHEMGTFRLSTMDWNYVPWMEAFKSRLMYLWSAPAAYYMGLIDGYTVIRFRVSRDGQLVRYEVLEHHGHETLQESSVNAIESVFPFRPLPADFPDSYLDITGTLIYPGYRQR